MQTRKNLVQLLFLLRIRQVSRHLRTFALTTRTSVYMNQAMGHPKVTEKSQHNPAPLLSSDKLERLRQKLGAAGVVSTDIFSVGFVTQLRWCRRRNFCPPRSNRIQKHNMARQNKGVGSAPWALPHACDKQEVGNPAEWPGFQSWYLET